MDTVKALALVEKASEIRDKAVLIVEVFGTGSTSAATRATGLGLVIEHQKYGSSDMIEVVQVAGQKVPTRVFGYKFSNAGEGWLDIYVGDGNWQQDMDRLYSQAQAAQKEGKS